MSGEKFKAQLRVHVTYPLHMVGKLASTAEYGTRCTVAEYGIKWGGRWWSQYSTASSGG